jgi:glyoxylase I family protein
MPTFSAVSHISFSVRDADKTARWWSDVFGLDQVAAIADDTWRSVLLELAPHLAIEFQEHQDNEGEEFDPVRTGFDHMGLKVDSREELDRWQAHFEQMGVEHTPVVEADYGGGPTYVLTFKDPDRIQFEMFHWPDHP